MNDAKRVRVLGAERGEKGSKNITFVSVRIYRTGGTSPKYVFLFFSIAIAILSR